MSRSEATCDVGVVGLGTMGGNLALNLASRGHRVAGETRSLETARRLAAEHPEAGLVVAEDLEDLARRLARPRRIVLLVPAGAPVDDVLDALDPLLEDGDVVVDGGNSHFTDTERRCDRAASRPWRFVGMGVSGGGEGALRGPSLMPGGDARAWEPLRPLLESIAARSDAGPCVAWCGARSAGHFVKMVHNGIEYAEMQHLAEAVQILRRGLGLEAERAADLFARWNEGPLESFLVEITADILRAPDPERPGALLLDAVLDSAGQKGTGRWTAQAALELGVAVPSIGAAVDARFLSAEVALRHRAAELFGDAGREPFPGLEPGDVEAALLGARSAAFAQGFALLDRAARERDYGTELAEVARIWKAGCILRARLLDDVRAALQRDPGGLLVLAPELREPLVAVLPAWRRVVAGALAAGLPVPGLSASLAWVDTLATARGSAGLIQAQRDTFGAHTYERVDRPGEKVHSDWRTLAGRRSA